MTFENSAYAINGARIGAALARRALYAEARAGGIVQRDDLKVSQLSVAGAGLLISEGVALVLNDYQDDPNEVYVASNPSSHTITESEMPPASPSDRSFIVAVVVGDPDFSQAGHPWMPSTGVPAGEEDTFQYVRPTLIQVAAGATTLDASYPALPLARVDIPANTATITNSMITDLRKLSRVRQEQQILVSPGGTFTNADPNHIAAGSSWQNWGSSAYSPSVAVPSWATRAIVVASVNGVRLDDSSVNVAGNVRAKLGGVVGPYTQFDFPARTGSVRDNLQAAGEYDVTSIAGTTVAVRIEGFQDAPASPTLDQRLALRWGSQTIFDIRFFEE